MEAFWKTTCEASTQRDENSKLRPTEAGSVSMELTELLVVTFLKKVQ
jgi:hypothetical protein